MWMFWNVNALAQTMRAFYYYITDTEQKVFFCNVTAGVLLVSFSLPPSRVTICASPVTSFGGTVIADFSRREFTRSGYFLFFGLVSVNPRDACFWGESQRISCFWNTQTSPSGTNNHDAFKVTLIAFLTHSDAQTSAGRVMSGHVDITRLCLHGQMHGVAAVWDAIRFLTEGEVEQMYLMKWPVSVFEQISQKA